MSVVGDGKVVIAYHLLLHSYLGLMLSVAFEVRSVAPPLHLLDILVLSSMMCSGYGFFVYILQPSLCTYCSHLSLAYLWSYLLDLLYGPRTSVVHAGKLLICGFATCGIDCGGPVWHVYTGLNFVYILGCARAPLTYLLPLAIR